MGTNCGIGIIIICISIGPAAAVNLNGDKNGDRFVDLRDLALVLAGDVNDYNEIAEVAEDWLKFLPITWYVDANNGSDSYNGTEAQPWKTLARAQTKYSGAGEKVLDGDTVIFKGGEYGSFIENTRHRFKTIYMAAEEAKCTLGKIDLGTSSRNLRFEGFEITSTCDFVRAGGIELVGSKIQYPRRLEAPTVAVNIDKCNGVMIKNCKILNCETGIQGSDANDITIEGNLIQGVMADTMELLRCNDVNITSNHLRELHHNRKEIKNSWSEPVAWNPVQEGVSVDDRKNFDTLFTIGDTVAAGLVCYMDVPDANENGSRTAPRDFTFIYHMTIGIRPNVTLQSGDLSIRLSSGTDCNSGDIEDIPLTNFKMNDSDSNNWGMKDLPANTLTTITISYLDQEPNLMAIYDTSQTPPKFICYVSVGHSIGRFDLSEPNAAVRTIGIVMNRDVGPFAFRIDVTKGFDFSDGRHQDFIVGNGRGWRIRNNILHDGTAQGIFTSTGSLRDCLIEQNVFYDFQGTTLTNMTVSGTSTVRFNTLIGYKRAKTNSSSEYAANSQFYFAGNATMRLSDATLDNVMIYNNICGGTLTLPVDSITGVPTVYWDYNIVQNSNTGTWGTDPWPMHSVKIAGSSEVNCDFRDFFEDADFSYNVGRVMDHRLKANTGLYPWPGNFGTAAWGLPAKGMGTLDENEEFILDNGNSRQEDMVSVGAYQY